MGSSSSPPVPPPPPSQLVVSYLAANPDPYLTVFRGPSEADFAQADIAVALNDKLGEDVSTDPLSFALRPRPGCRPLCDFCRHARDFC